MPLILFLMYLQTATKTATEVTAVYLGEGCVSQTVVFMGKNGGRGRDRTYDQSIKSRMLYQLSYASRPWDLPGREGAMQNSWKGIRSQTVR